MNQTSKLIYSHKTKAPSWEFLCVNVTPDLAAALLSGNHGNRKVIKSNIANLVRDMKTGDWVLTPEFIMIGEDGRLLNGQHRLLAVQSSGCSVPMMFALDVSEEVFQVLDQGKKRGAHEALGLSKELVADVHIILGLYEGNDHSKSRAQVSAVADFIEAERQDFLEMAGSAHPKFKQANARMAAFLYHRNFIRLGMIDKALNVVCMYQAIANGSAGDPRFSYAEIIRTNADAYRRSIPTRQSYGAGAFARLLDPDRTARGKPSYKEDWSIYQSTLRDEALNIVENAFAKLRRDIAA